MMPKSIEARPTGGAGRTSRSRRTCRSKGLKGLGPQEAGKPAGPPYPPTETPRQAGRGRQRPYLFLCRAEGRVPDEEAGGRDGMTVTLLAVAG